MIQVDGLVFEYPGRRALDRVSFQIARGSITALVGPNGAGKTTLLRCLAALDQPLAGSIAIDGIDVLEHPRECHRRVGFLSDTYGLYDALTVRQCLHYVALAQSIAPERAREAVVVTADRLGLSARLQDRVGELSRGLRQRVAIGQAIVHAPGVLLLDEPASGLDPEARHALAELFLRLRGEGMTLLVSSHILAELEEYSSEMLILRDGVILEQTALTAAKSATARLRVSLAENHASLRSVLEAFSGVRVLATEARDAVIEFTGDDSERHLLLKALLDAGLPVCGFECEKHNLQESYLSRVRTMDTRGKTP